VACKRATASRAPVGARAAAAAPAAHLPPRLPRDLKLRATFNRIDTHGKGHITECDLELFARANGLPPSYAALFVSAVRESHAAGNGGDDEDDEEDAAGPGAGGFASTGACDTARGVTYEAFRSFAASREAALRRAFGLFDVDGDGLISLADVDRSLAHVAVVDPATRCVYRTKRQVVKQLLRKAELEDAGRRPGGGGAGGGLAAAEGAGSGAAAAEGGRCVHSAARPRSGGQ
jgi:Ca2+-binding EF-hand superfamily protein